MGAGAWMTLGQVDAWRMLGHGHGVWVWGDVGACGKVGRVGASGHGACGATQRAHTWRMLGHEPRGMGYGWVLGHG